MSNRAPEQMAAETAAEGGLVFDPIPAIELQQIRADGADEAGNRLAVQVDNVGGNPLPCQLHRLTSTAADLATVFADGKPTGTPSWVPMIG